MYFLFRLHKNVYTLNCKTPKHFRHAEWVVSSSFTLLAIFFPLFDTVSEYRKWKFEIRYPIFLYFLSPNILILFSEFEKYQISKYQCLYRKCPALLSTCELSLNGQRLIKTQYIEFLSKWSISYIYQACYNTIL
jgi:hypothetical protein